MKAPGFSRKKYDLAWHFVRSNAAGELVLRDGRVVEPGKWLVHKGEATICENGLHASRRAIDALGHLGWDDGFACLVEVDAIVTERDDKLMCRRRRIVRAVKCDELLRGFARSCALDVIHLWEAPPAVVEHLKTGNPDLRYAARSATSAATWAATRAAAWAAAACEDAARYAAWDAARYAARSAARSAAWDAGLAAAWDAVWCAATDRQNTRLEALLKKAMGL